MAENELQEEKTIEINGLKLTKKEISKIAMICDYLVLDRFNDISSFIRFEKCFGPLLYKEDPNFLIEAYQEICGPKRKYITFGRMISAYIKWKTNSSTNESFNKFMDLVFNKMIKNENEVVGQLEEGTRIFGTRNVRGRKVMSKFSVFTDSSKNIIQGFNVQYDDFFDSLLCSKKKEGQDKNITLEMNFLPNGKTILDRDGISHIAGKFSVKNKLIKFLIFKCRSGKTFYIGDNTENENEEIELFIFGTSSCQLKTLRIETIDDKLAYLEPKFQPSMRLNQKIISFDAIDDQYIKENVTNSKLIFEENELQNFPTESLDKKTLLIPCITDDAFISDKKSLEEEISGKNFNDFYKSFTVIEKEKEENGEKKEEEKKEEKKEEEVKTVEEKKKLEENLLTLTVRRIGLLKYYIKKFKVKENIEVLKTANRPKEDRINMDKYLAKIKRFKKKVNVRKEENKKELENIKSNPFDDYEQEEDWPEEEKKQNEQKEEIKNEEPKNEIKEEKKDEKKEEEQKNEGKEEIKVEVPIIEVQPKEEIKINEEEQKNEEKIEIHIEVPKLEEQPKGEEKIEVNMINSEENQPTEEKIRIRGKPRKLLKKKLDNKNENKEEEKIEKNNEKIIVVEEKKEEEEKEIILKDKKEEVKKEEKIEEKKEEIENLNSYQDNKLIEDVKEEPAKNEEEVQPRKTFCANCLIN